jgi:hypothetical protein
MSYGITLNGLDIREFLDADNAEHTYKWISWGQLRTLLDSLPDETPIWANPVTGNLMLMHPGQQPIRWVDVASERIDEETGE